MQFTPTADTDRLVFRLWANAPRPAQSGGRVDVAAASVDGEPVAGVYEVNDTVYRIDRAIGAGATVTARLEFALTLPGAINDRIAHAGSSIRLGSILPTLSWIRGRGWDVDPGVDAFAESVASEIADYDVRVAAPAGVTVLATGEEVEPGRFVASAVRDWAATAGTMRVAEALAQDGRTRIRVGVAEGAGGDPARFAQQAATSFDDFVARYGPHPFPTLSISYSPSLSGGIEFPQHIQMGEGVAHEHLVHEVAHMWFYALVGNDQFDHPWLDEGLTQYAEARQIDLVTRELDKAIPAAGAGRMGETMGYWAAHTGSYFRSVYIQGVHALAAYADAAGGHDAVDCGLRRYVLENAYGVAEPADLLAALGAQTGVDPASVFAGFGIRS